jgi:putative ABC transport system permease protein
MIALLRALTKLYPKPFRARFGDELLADIGADLSAARKRGVVAEKARAIAIAFDILRSALAEYWTPSWSSLPHPDTYPQEYDMSSRISDWIRDLRHASRTLRRSPGFAAVSVITLALAIGATAGMFGVVNTVILQPLPYANPDRLVVVRATAPGSQLPPEFGLSDEFLPHYTENSRLIEDAGIFYGGTSTARVGERVERVRFGFATPTLYSTLGTRPIIGRLPVAEDLDQVVMISFEMWRDWFGGDTAVIGQSHGFSYETRQVIGVLPQGFALPAENTHFIVNFSVVTDSTLDLGNFGAGFIARTKPDVDPEALALELTTLSKGLPDRFGGTPAYAKIIEQHRAVVRPLQEQVLGNVTSPILVLLGAMGVVLLIACANVANLLLVRAEVRTREMAVRAAIGAGRGELMRVMLAESFVIAGLAAVGAVLFAWITFPLFVASAPAGVPRISEVSMDLPTIGFTILAAFTAAVACGVIPALRAASPDLSRLREAGRGVARGGHWLRNALVVGQTALALVLLIGSGLLMRSFAKLNQVDAGYSTENIFTFQIAPEQPGLTDGPAWARFSHMFMDRMRAMPGVESVGLIENVPLDEGTATLRFVNEAQAGDPQGGVRLSRTFAAGEYFKTMGVSVLAGRPFEDADHLSTPGHVVVSRAAAEQLWPGEDAVGRRLQVGGQPDWHTVVGVVADVIQNDWRQAGAATVYFPMVGPTPTSWRLGSPAYVVKTPRAEFIAPEILAIVKEIAPEAPMYRQFTMKQLAERSMERLSFTMLTLAIAAALALILGAVGLYGVLSYIVAQRTREIGVRMALGAAASQVRGMVVMQGARVVALGVIIGGVGALAATRALESLLFGVTRIDIPTFAAMSAVMIGIGLLACYVPARRASNVDPIEAIRGE